MRYFSTFSGIGGFELGIHNAHEYVRKQNATRQSDVPTQWSFDTLPTCVGYSEIDKYASSVYEYNFPGAKNYGDITRINEKELPDFDCLVGGFPCQAFSIAGKRGGFTDTRGTLFFDLARILKEKQPRLFVFENVKGLLSHDEGRTFRTIIATIDELGYDCQWQVLNSKNHGVPQNRERIYIVGHLRGTSRPEVFPVGGESKDTDEERTSSQPMVIGSSQRHAAVTTNGIVPTLSTAMGSGGGQTPMIQQLNEPIHSNDRVYASDGISPTLNTMQGGNRQPFISEETKIRRLTPKECERLQGFPDDWTAMSTKGAVSDTQRYKMCGNAVTTNVVQVVFEKLFANT